MGVPVEGGIFLLQLIKVNLRIIILIGVFKLPAKLLIGFVYLFDAVIVNHIINKTQI